MAAGPADGLRLAVVGARRVRHGTGPFLARQCRSAGARVVAVLGTTPETAAAARDDLAREGLELRAATSLAEVLAEEPLDALVVASPAGTHLPWLQAALEAGLHVLCEKPLLAGPEDGPGAGPAQVARTRSLVRAFAGAGRVLAENCQWVRTLASFRRLHPDLDTGAVRRFRMWLAPAIRGRARWLEVLSHPLSLLQAVAPGPATLEAVRFPETDGPDGVAGRLEFRWRAGSRLLECEVLCLEAAPGRPRPAGYALDDRECHRRILEPGYRFHFLSGRDQVAAPDPMEENVADFLRRVAVARAPLAPDEGLVQRQALLAELLRRHAGG